jgi:hypothetical protein
MVLKVGEQLFIAQRQSQVEGKRAKTGFRSYAQLIHHMRYP